MVGKRTIAQFASRIGQVAGRIEKVEEKKDAQRDGGGDG